MNIFLFLFTLSYFIVGADLCKEMAKEKNEIGFFVATLSNSVQSSSNEVLSLLEKILPEDVILPPIIYSIHTTDAELFPPGRSPPTPSGFVIPV